MNIRVLLVCTLCPTVSVLGLRAADEPAAAHAGEHAGHDHGGNGHEDQTELGEHMEKVSGAYKRLNRQVANAAQNEDSLKQIATMRTHAEAAAKLTPAKAADLPADQRAKFVEGFQKSMQGFLADLDKVEAALKAGKNDEAAALVKTLKKDQDDGHKEYRKKPQKKG